MSTYGHGTLTNETLADLKANVEGFDRRGVSSYENTPRFAEYQNDIDAYLSKMNKQASVINQDLNDFVPLTIDHDLLSETLNLISGSVDLWSSHVAQFQKNAWLVASEDLGNSRSEAEGGFYSAFDSLFKLDLSKVYTWLDIPGSVSKIRDYLADDDDLWEWTNDALVNTPAIPSLLMNINNLGSDLQNWPSASSPLKSSLDALRESAEKYSQEIGEYFTEITTINWLQQNVGEQRNRVNDELNGQSRTLGEEIEFWEALGYEVEYELLSPKANDPTPQPFLVKNWYGKTTEAQYNVEIVVSASDDGGADLDGVDSFSYNVWDDVHRNQRSDFDELYENGKLEEIYVESRFDLEIDLM